MSIEVILIKVAQLILSLSILVIIHEFGHFAAAKIFKTKVEKFYLFFNPWFSLLNSITKEPNMVSAGCPWAVMLKLPARLTSRWTKNS